MAFHTAPGYCRLIITLHLTLERGTFHTGNIEPFLEPFLTQGYETLLQRRVRTTFVLLTLHCGTKRVQCETTWC